MTAVLAKSIPFLDGHRHLLSRELGRFFELAGAVAQSGRDLRSMLMPSCAVDAFWHWLEEDEGFAEEFSTFYAGEPLFHIPGDDPRGVGTGFGDIPWVADYEAKFGPLDQVWFTDANGVVNDEALNKYWATGEVRLSWDCNPGRGPKH